MNACEKSLPGGLLLTVRRPSSDVVVVAIEGEVDLANCPELDRVVMRVTAEPGIERVIIDLTGVGFLAACGVRCLARLQMRLAAGRHRMQLVVSPDSGTVRRVLVLVNGFEIVDSLAETGATC